MVSKLALAVGEAIFEAAESDADEKVAEGLFKHFRRIQEGLGLHKTPARYGAFPIDPYSHTPGFAGVQQPGMTGQVKEDVITRFLELGVRVDAGEVRFTPVALRREEFLAGPEIWTQWASGRECREQLEAGSLAFSLCGVPVVYHLGETAAVRVFHGTDQPDIMPGAGLGEVWSRALFERDGRILKIEVDIPTTLLR